MHILITGVISKPPVIRTSSNGNTYLTANIRTTQRNREGATEVIWASIIAFRDEARDTLARLNPGDSVSIGGACTVGIWERGGQYHPSISITAETVAAARPAPRNPEKAKPSPEPVSYTLPAEPELYDDDIPF